jgi:hypothetical protein
MLNIIKNTINRVFASGVDSDASAFITATGLSGTTQKSAITTLVKDLKSSGLWSKMKAVYPMVTDNVNQLSYTTTFNTGFYKTDGTATLTSNYAEAPDGTNTATRMLGNNSNSYMYYNINDGLGSGNRTYSIYLKAGSDTQVLLTFNSDGTTVSQNVTLTSSWQRFQLTKNITNSSSSFFITVENVGSGLDILMWGVQVQFGTTASAYQPILTTPSAFMASQMKYNLKDARDLDAAFRLTWSGGWTYSATGATPNGTNAYADTKLSPSTSLSLNSTHISYYSRTQSNGTEVEIGSANTGGVNGSLIEIRTSGVTYYRVNSGITFLTYTDSDSRSFYIANRTASNIVNGWRNSSKVVSGTTASSSLNSENYYLGALNQANSALYFSTKQASFASIGDGLSDSDAQLLNQIVEKYQVALSRGVQAAQSFYYNSAYSNEANTYLYSTQITGTTQVSAINTLINGLKANNLWTKMKAVYPFVTDYRNLLAYTEDFSNAVWTKVSSTVSTNVVNAPNGTLTADKLIETAVADQHIAFTQNNANTGSIYTFSAYLKAAERNYGVIQIVDSSASNKRFTVLADLTNGTILTTRSLNSPTNTSSSIQDAGNGWYRITCTMAQTGGTICYTNVGISSTATPTWNGNDFPTYLGVASNGIYVWGAQCELGTSASDYQAVLGANNYATNVAAQMKFNLVNPQDTDAAFRLAFSGGWTYSTNGAQPNGTNGYADTKLVPSTAIASANSNSIGYYSGSNLAETSSDPVNMGAYMGATQSTSILKSNTTFNSRLNGDQLSYATSVMKGSFISTRPSASVANLFLNNNKVATITPNGTLPNGNILIGTLSISSTSPYTGGYVKNDFRFAFLADGFNDAEVAILYQLIQDYQTTLSRNV